MENQVPICSHTFMFYSGAIGHLEELKNQFIRTLNNHVLYFGPKKIKSEFVVFVNDETDAQGSALRLELDKCFDIHRKKKISESLSDAHKDSYVSVDCTHKFEDSFSFSVYVTEGMSFKDFGNLVFSLTDCTPKAVDSNGNHLFLFDITEAKPEQAFMICRLTALVPIFTIVHSLNSGIITESHILPAFPHYVVLDEQTCSILDNLCKHSKDQNIHDRYRTYEEIRSEVGGLTIRPNKEFTRLIPEYITVSKKKVVNHKRSITAYHITDDGEFMLEYSRLRS